MTQAHWNQLVAGEIVSTISGKEFAVVGVSLRSNRPANVTLQPMHGPKGKTFTTADYGTYMLNGEVGDYESPVEDSTADPLGDRSLICLMAAVLLASRPGTFATDAIDTAREIVREYDRGPSAGEGEPS